jgi:hypothetical protein
MNEPSIGVSVGGVAPMTRSLNPGGSMRPGERGRQRWGGRAENSRSAMNESVISAHCRPAVVSGATRDG